MRKLVLIATTALAAMALTAAMAAPAQADRDFLLTNPAGSYCNPCEDTGYTGDFDLVNPVTGIAYDYCDVDYDVRFTVHGALETYNTSIDCHYTGAYACDDSMPGQLRVPDTGPAEIDLEICLGPNADVSDITFTAFNNPRRWAQLSPDPLGTLRITNAEFPDTYSADNVKVELQ
jgi:hypothetical protein